MGIRGYKVFNPDWTCRGFKYEVGKTYKHNGDIIVCAAGFHFCQKLSDCFNYYHFNSDNKVAEVEAIGNISTEGTKSVTDEIKIIRELSWYEVLDLVNTGKHCTGRYNSGDYNSGNWNSGDYNRGRRNSSNCNIGDYNSGKYNSGSFNSGDWNSGSFNSGNFNSGNFNSGDFNSGRCNSGNWNSTNFSSGFFNSIEPPIYAFNKPLEGIDGNTFKNNLAVRAMNQNFINQWWMYSKDMTEEEKQEHPEHEITGGYLKTVDFKTACKMMWYKMTKEEKAAVKDIPNFDAEVFKDITGIDVD